MEERCSLNSSIWDSSTEGATHTYLTLFKIGFRANPSECGLFFYLLLYWHSVTPITAGIYGNIQKKLFQEVSRRVQGSRRFQVPSSGSKDPTRHQPDWTVNRIFLEQHY
jgi:hypothetical protein